MFPILITVTLFRDGRKILINTNHIEEIMDGKSIQSAEDDFYDAMQEDSTLIFVKGRPVLRVKETIDVIQRSIQNATKNVASSIVQRLHAEGFIGH